MSESFCILLCMCGSKSSKANVYFILKFEVVTFQGLDSHIWLVLCIGWYSSRRPGLPLSPRLCGPRSCRKVFFNI